MVINKDKTKTPPPPLLPRLIFTPSLPTPLHPSPEQIRGMGNGSYDQSQSVMRCLCCSFFLMSILCSSVGSAWASVLQVMSTSSNTWSSMAAVWISPPPWSSMSCQGNNLHHHGPLHGLWGLPALAPPSLSSLTLFVAGLFLTIFLTPHCWAGFLAFSQIYFPRGDTSITDVLNCVL